MSSEAELAAAVARGDPQALGRLLKALDRRVYNICLRMVGDHEEAEQVAQEAMLKTIEHVHDFRGQSSPATWVIRLAMNLCVAFLRKKKLRLTVAPVGAGGGDDQSADLRELEPAQGGPTSESVGQLQVALARLDEDFRSVLVLRDVDEMNYEQIADVLAAPVGSIKSRLFRARLALRHELLRLAPPPKAAPSSSAGPSHG